LSSDEILIIEKKTRALTSDEHVHVYTPGRFATLSRLIITFIVVVLLLIPMAVLYNVQNDRGRFITIVAAILIFAMIISFATVSKKIDIFTAAAAFVLSQPIICEDKLMQDFSYGAVLVVFVARPL